MPSLGTMVGCPSNNRLSVPFQDGKYVARQLNGPFSPNSSRDTQGLSSTYGLCDCLVRQRNGKRALSEEGGQGVLRLKLGEHASIDHIKLATSIQEDPIFYFGSTFYPLWTEADHALHLDGRLSHTWPPVLDSPRYL